jgi:hypothetical protein
MSNTQLYFGIGLPCVTVLASMVVSLIQISAIRLDIREIRSDIKAFTRKVAEIDSRPAILEERVS